MTDIAVLMPCYNPAVSELTETLESLQSQDVPFRLYIVDDGSKKPADYELHCKGMDARIIRLPKNLGITGAMNAGLNEIMRGSYRYIARIDCGDVCKPQRFARQVAFLDEHPDTGILGSAVEFKLVDETGQLVGSKTLEFPLTHEGCVQRLYLNTAIIHPAMMIRRAVFEKLVGYSEAYPAAEDYELQWRAAANGFGLANLPETLLVKEESPGSISQLRRRRQIYNRMRIQWHNIRPTVPRAWLGIAKSLVTWAAPAGVVHGLKFILGGKK